MHLSEDIYNVEGQDITSRFPFKRHLFYWSYIFANGIAKGGAYQDLCPITSIVIYKDKGEFPLISSAKLEGNLLVDDDNKLLNLYAVNAKKWQDAVSEWLRVFLCIITLGISNDTSKFVEAGIDVESDVFKSMYRSMIYSTGKTYLKLNKDNKESEDYNMVDWWISEEDRQKAEAMGETKGETRVLKIANLAFKGYKVEKIAEEIGAPLEEVTRIFSEMTSGAVI